MAMSEMTIEKKNIYPQTAPASETTIATGSRWNAMAMNVVKTHAQRITYDPMEIFLNVLEMLGIRNLDTNKTNPGSMIGMSLE